MILNKLKKRISGNKKVPVNKIKPILKPVKYYFVIGSSQFLLKNEPLEEMLRERAQFLKREKKQLTAIVSVDKTFITWLKLRIQNVGEGNFVSGEDITSPLASEI